MNNEIYIPNNGKIIFTRGTFILRMDDALNLISGNSKIKIDNNLDLHFLIKLCDTYKIIPVAKYLNDNSNEIFTIYNKNIFYTGDFISQLSNMISKLKQTIIELLFKNKKEYYNFIDQIPVEIIKGGKHLLIG